MKPYFLFPYWCRFLGYALIIAHVPVALGRKMLAGGRPMAPESVNAGIFNNHHLFFIATFLLMLAGLFLVAFSKEKIEDEQISQLRLDSLRWAMYLNYILLIISLIFITDTEHIVQLSLWTLLLLFIIRFRWKLFQNNRLLKKDGDLR